MVTSRIVKHFHCLRCGREVIDGDGGMLELGLCWDCIEWQKLEEEEGNNGETSSR